MPKFNSPRIPASVKRQYKDNTFKEAIHGKKQQLAKWTRVLDRAIKAWKEDYPTRRVYLQDGAVKKLWWKKEYIANQLYAMQSEYKEHKTENTVNVAGRSHESILRFFN